jgi:hypothetical protein
VDISSVYDIELYIKKCQRKLVDNMNLSVYISEHDCTSNIFHKYLALEIQINVRKLERVGDVAFELAWNIILEVYWYICVYYVLFYNELFFSRIVTVQADVEQRTKPFLWVQQIWEPNLRVHLLNLSR